jgi:flagellin
LGAQGKLAGSVERLSSGLRINRARDDAAGLGVANSLTAQINGANQGVRNLNDAISMVQTAEGAIAAASEMGQRILMLATQGANDTLGVPEREAIQTEMKQLIISINSIGARTTFSGNPLLDEAANVGSAEKYSMQISNDSDDAVSLDKLAFKSIGSGSATYVQMDAAGTDANDINSKAVGLHTVYVDVGSTKVSKTLEVITQGSVYKLDGQTFDEANVGDLYLLTANGTGQAGTLSTAINNALSTGSFTAVQEAATEYVVDLGTQRSLLGAYQNQMEYTLANITELSSNLQSARSRVIDTDYASETAALTKGQILQQAATAMLAQANQMPNVILTLLK